jgi:phosphate uptake regulator
MNRKVIRQGNNTLTITLPHDWTERFNIRPGDELAVAERGKELSIAAASTPLSLSAEVDVTGLDGSSITLLLRGLYRRGYDNILVTTKDPNIMHLRTRKMHTVEDCINSEVNRLIGFEVFNSSRTRFELKSISAEQIEDFDTVLRRIFLLTLQYYGDFRKALLERDATAMQALDEKPVALTKFISYASRLLNKKGHAKYDYTPFLYHIVEMLELISDSIKVTVRFCAGRKMALNRRTLVAIAQVEEALRMYYESYYKFSYASFAEFIALHDRIVRAIDAGYEEPSKADIAVLLNLRMIPDVIRESLRIRASIL